MKSKSPRSNAKRTPKRRRPPQQESNQLLAAGLEHHRAGRLAEAQRCYRKALEKSPRFAEAAHLMGRVLYDQQEPEEALPWLAKAVAFGPMRANAFNDLGNLLHELGRMEEAEGAYRRVLELEPENADAHNNLGTVLKGRGLLDEARDAYQRAVKLAPKHYSAYYNLGNLFKREERFEEAASAYREALRIDPRQSYAHRNLCAVLKSLGHWEQATQACREWLDREPENPVARHMMAAFSGEEIPARADDEYVAKVFDDFAETFDRQLASLNNSQPEKIGEALAEEGVPPTGLLDVLDAGCGTGLCGPILRPYAQRLIGVDLSEQMLKKARDCDFYDELTVAELTEFIATRPESYDLIAPSDTLVYFGDLEPVFGVVAASLKPGGRCVFTLEQMVAPPENGIGYQLNRHGRYAHWPDYVEACLSASGMEVRMARSVDLREQAGQPVAGLLITAALQ